MSATPSSEVRQDEWVLIVNDLPDQLTMMASLLRKAGYSVLTAEEGLEAFSLAKQHQPNLVISDVCMPSVNGLEFCRLLRADDELRSVPILLVSALLHDTPSLVEGFRAGADDYLEVPFDGPRLVAKVTRLLERARLEASYRDLVEQATDVIFTQDLSGRITSINAAGAQFIGRNPQELIGKSFSSVFGILGLDPRGNALPTYSDDNATGQEFKHQFEVKDLSGDDRWLDLTISPLRGRGSQVVGLRGLARDITARKQAELALRDSEERYRLLFESIPQPIWVYDEETLEFLTVNDAATLIYGYTREEFRAMTVDDILNPQVGLDGSESPQSFGPLQHQTKSKRPIHVEITSHPVIFDGKTSRLVIINDVTERTLLDQVQQRMQASLQQSAMEWRQTFDAIDFPVLIVDLEGHIRRSNYCAELIVGTSSEEIAGKAVGDLGEVQPWKKAAELIEVLRQTKLTVTQDVRDETTGKTWTIALFLVSEFGTFGDRAILIVQDITNRTELEASLAQSRIMSVLGAVVAGVAHEVRNPLFALSANLDAFERRFSDRSEYRKYTEVLRSEIERLSVLMEDLLEYGKPFLGNLYPASLQEIINRSIKSCRASAEAAQVQLVNNISDDLPQILVDRRRIATVFGNLIENAIQHSPPQGVVTMAARRVVDNNQEWLECVISDIGSGILDEDLPKIFEPFFSKRRGGTGLGLAIAQKSMEEHGGRLRARNNPAGGASMIAMFPLPAEGSH
jgi:PAS domain S-box-containing protein